MSSHCFKRKTKRESKIKKSTLYLTTDRSSFSLSNNFGLTVPIYCWYLQNYLVFLPIVLKTKHWPPADWGVSLKALWFARPWRRQPHSAGFPCKGEWIPLTPTAKNNVENAFTCFSIFSCSKNSALPLGLIHLQGGGMKEVRDVSVDIWSFIMLLLEDIYSVLFLL